MSPSASISLLITNDLIDAVLLEGWPDDIPRPRIVVFDYAGSAVPEECILHVHSGAPNAGLTAREFFPEEHHAGHRYPSPSEILAALDAKKHVRGSTF